eukprot:tig00000459_g1067.t1
MASCTLYECLEVARDADLSQIRAAYRRLSLLHHPDRNPGDASATARFQRLAEAYETLSDGQKPVFGSNKRHKPPDAAPDRRRAEYDRRLAMDEADARSGARRSAYASPYRPSAAGRAGADAFARAQATFDAFFAQADFLFGMMDLQSQMLLGGGLAHRARRAPAGAPLHPFASPFGFAMGPLAAGGTATWQPFGLELAGIYTCGRPVLVALNFEFLGPDPLGRTARYVYVFPMRASRIPLAPYYYGSNAGEK